LTAQLAAPFQEPPVSHRSAAFNEVRQEVDRLLSGMAASTPYLLAGSGTLANEAMLAQIKRLDSKGLILVNGEFGRRLATQAERLGLDYAMEQTAWGQAFDGEKIAGQLQAGNYGWVLMVHGETSTGQLNDFRPLADICIQQGIRLCLDCISSFGAVPLSLKDVWLATAASGKAIGTMSGIAIVFAHHKISPDGKLPSYLDLGLYAEGVPFTFPSSVLESLKRALCAYPERYGLLDRRFRRLLEDTKDWPTLAAGYPTSRTFEATEGTRFLAQDAHLSGFELHAASGYLKDRTLFQISCIQPDFEKDWQQFLEFHEIYQRYHTTAKARHI